MGKKRFTDVEKWADPWFMELPPEMKLLWMYICDSCDNAGVWAANKRLAGVQIGAPIDWDLAINLFEGRINLLENGQKWCLNKFVMFQNPNGLTEKSHPHMQVISALKAHGLDFRPFMQSTLLASGSTLLSRVHEEDKDNSPLDWKGSPEGKPSSRTEQFGQFLKKLRLAWDADAIAEWLALAAELGCKGGENIAEMVETATVKARKNGTVVRFARHAESEARIWNERRKTERMTKESA